MFKKTFTPSKIQTKIYILYDQVKPESEDSMKIAWLIAICSGLLALQLGLGSAIAGVPGSQEPVTDSVIAGRALLDQYCVGCHNEQTRTGGLALDSVDISNVAENTEIWEKVVGKLRGRMMPPAGALRPDDAGYESLVGHLVGSLDRLRADQPNPGRVATFRRLNRTEYQNAIRDLLDLDIDGTALLPPDDSSFGFDNITVGDLPPTLLERYLSAAQKISRLAIGSPLPAPDSHIVVVPADRTQERHVDGLPLGTRGGTLVPYTFPRDGMYEIQALLSRNRNENIEGLTEPHEIEISVDGQRIGLFRVEPNRNRMGAYYADEDVDAGLQVRVRVTAGPHSVGVAFLSKNSALVETQRQPYQAFFNMDRHPRVQPALRSVAIAGPFDSTGSGDTLSRRRIFSCRPADPDSEASCARTIMSSLARRAYRRPVSDQDIEPLLRFYEEGHANGGFEAGIEMSLRALLASSEYLFRIERDPEGTVSGTNYRISDLELASRISFFLWSSIPDDELLSLAEQGELADDAVLEQQVRRMLADSRADALVTNFAGQWLYLRNLDAIGPNNRLFPDFDDNLRLSFRSETELLFGHIMNEDRSVLELLDADYTFLNERLAKHYGIPNVYGSRFRRVELDSDSPRGGLLGHGSILTVTSYSTRTSPVLRGKWILESILGTPPPAPPPNVPALGENTPGTQALSVRERMVQHRRNPACASCHQLMDPAGLAMENFDATGRWRTESESGSPIDAAGELPDGSSFIGMAGLREALLERPEQFVGTMTEKLLTYGLGRGIEYYDAPTVREITRNAADNGYRFSSLILSIVESTPFQMRRSQ
jgi:mono/diheme cytochrome c family protein